MKLAAMEAPKSGGADRPPGWFWLLPAGAALLRTVPFLWLQFTAPPPGQAYIKLGFIPKDFLSYLAFMRQVGDTGAGVFVNPFTTDPQSPRFVLLFHWLLGLIESVTGHPNAVLELSRIPLAFAFFWLLWRFLGPVLVDRKERLWACGLIAFSGGMEAFITPWLTSVTAPWADQFRQDTWDVFGWSTYASFFNPLWIAAFIGMLLFLGPVLKPDGPRSGRELAQVGLAFLGTYLGHPYTAIFLLAVVMVLPVLEWVLGAPVSWRKYGRIAAALAAPLLVIGILTHWQDQDPVYKASSSNVFGPQNLAVFWYPITLGLVGLAALRGIGLWFSQARPYRFALVSWVVTAVLLHSSPVINGYKFAFVLPMALCILAAPVVRDVSERLFHANWRSRLLGGLAAVVLFGQALILPFLAVRGAMTDHTIPLEYQEVIDVLSTRPPGNVFAPPDLGNLLPAYTPDRVWVGHWFLTPNFVEKANLYVNLTKNPDRVDVLEQLLNQAQIRYVVMPTSRIDPIVNRLGKRVVEKRSFGKMALLTLDLQNSP